MSSTSLASALTTIPTCGETVSVVLSFSDAPATTHTVRYQFCGTENPSSMTQFSVDCTTSGTTDHALTILPGHTADAYPGHYTFAAYATKTATGAVSIVDQGVFTFAPNPGHVPSCLVMLTALRAIRTGRATAAQRAMMLDGITLREMSDETLRKWEVEYAEQWRCYQQMLERAHGGSARNRTLVRFTR